MIRRLALAPLVAMALAWIAGIFPGYADEAAPAQISLIERSGAGLSMLVSVPADARVDLNGVTVSVAGHPASASARAGSTGAVRRTAVLAMDTSTSMSGPKFAAAKAAAAAYVDALPSDVYLGIVTYGGSVTTVLRPSRDRDRATSTLGRLALRPGTLLYDGVRTALDDAGTKGQRSILVLSDGADTASDESLGKLTGDIDRTGALVDVVAADRSGTTSAPLQRIAEAGRGVALPSDPTALSRTFAAEAGVLARQVLVTASLPAGLTATRGTVEVTLPTLPAAAGGTLTASAYADRLQAPLPASVADHQSRWVLPGWVLYLGVGVLALGIFALILTLAPRRPGASAEELVTSYTTRTGVGGAGVIGAPVAGAPGRHAPRLDAEHALASATTAAADLLKRNAGLEARIARWLDGAASDLKPAEWLLVHLVIAVGAALLGLLLGGGDPIVGLLFLLLGAIGPWAYLMLRRSRRRRRFAEALPDTLQLMSGSLSAGLSLAQTVDTVAHEGSDPISGEFRRVLVENRLGVELEDALDGVAERFDSPDFGWAVMAIRIQRQVGGNLAELLETVAATLRERQYVRRQAATLSAEGKLSAFVIGALPPIFTLYLLTTNRAYLHPLVHDPRGIVMIVFGIVWLGVGAFWMSRLVKVEV